MAWGTHADPDDDNDGFPDAEEQQATPPTDPADARSFPVRLPPAGTTTLVVDAASPLPAPQRTGTPAAPYRALSEALQALRTGRLPQVHTVQVRAGTYAPLTTQEIFPLDLSGLAGLTLQGEGTVVLDAGLTATVFQAAFSRDLVIEGFVITRGVNGIGIQDEHRHHHPAQPHHGAQHGWHQHRVNATGVVITENLLADNEQHGLLVAGELGGHGDAEYHAPEWPQWHGIVNTARATIVGNLFEGNLDTGMIIQLNATATVTHNTVRQNSAAGINIVLGSTAELTGNTSTDNGAVGFPSTEGSTATLTGNTSTNNGANGVSRSDSRREHRRLTGNTIEDNFFAWH